MASGNDTVSGDASLESEYVSLVGQNDKWSPGDNCTDRRGRGMETMRVIGFLFSWSVYFGILPSRNCDPPMPETKII